jgi:hypothetical protein
MNVELYKLILDQINTDPYSWKQQDWHSPCGTSHCVAGWAEYLTTGESINIAKTESIARKALDLTSTQAEYLFSPVRDLGELNRVLSHPLFTTDMDILEESSLSDSIDVLTYVCLNPNTPPHILLRLSTIRRRHLLVESIASNPNCPPEILSTLISSDHRSVVAAVLANPGCPVHILKTFFLSPDPKFRETALANPRV